MSVFSSNLIVIRNVFGEILVLVLIKCFNRDGYIQLSVLFVI